MPIRATIRCEKTRSSSRFFTAPACEPDLRPTDQTSHFFKTSVYYLKAFVYFVKAFFGGHAKSLEFLIDKDHGFRNLPRFITKAFDLNVCMANVRFHP